MPEIYFKKAFLFRFVFKNASKSFFSFSKICSPAKNMQLKNGINDPLCFTSSSIYHLCTTKILFLFVCFVCFNIYSCLPQNSIFCSLSFIGTANPAFSSLVFLSKVWLFLKQILAFYSKIWFF